LNPGGLLALRKRTAFLAKRCAAACRKQVVRAQHGRSSPFIRIALLKFTFEFQENFLWYTK